MRERFRLMTPDLNRIMMMTELSDLIIALKMFLTPQHRRSIPDIVLDNLFLLRCEIVYAKKICCLFADNNRKKNFLLQLQFFFFSIL